MGSCLGHCLSYSESAAGFTSLGLFSHPSEVSDFTNLIEQVEHKCSLLISVSKM